MAKGLVSPGERFNNWTVISEAEKDSKRGQQFLCKCICGTERVVRKANLGKVKGCGCDRKAYITSGRFTGKRPAVKKKAATQPAAFDGQRVKGREVEPPAERIENRPKYSERKKTTREQIEEKIEQRKLNELLKEEW